MFEQKYLGLNDLMKLAKEKSKASEKWAKVLQDLDAISKDKDDKREFNRHLKQYQITDFKGLVEYIEQ
jgi:uncharacterized Zn finger protein (UPF0148 family)